MVMNDVFNAFVFHDLLDQTFFETYGSRGIFIFGGGNKRLRNITKMYCQCQISHKRRKKECLGKFKFLLNRFKK
jgi:hypothetical protein